MSEMEKVWKEFDAMCKTHDGCKNCEWYGPRSCAMSYMFSRNQKLKSEAVKAVRKAMMGKIGEYAIRTIQGMIFDKGYNTAVRANNRLLAAAIKKIEGL